MASHQTAELVIQLQQHDFHINMYKRLTCAAACDDASVLCNATLTPCAMEGRQ